MFLRILIGVISISLVSCVSKSKFTALEVKNTQIQEENKILHAEINEASDKMEKQNQRIDDQRDQMIKQNVLNDQLITEKIDLQRRISELDRRINLITDEARSAQQTLNDELQQEIDQLKKRIAVLDSFQQEYFIVKQKLDDLISQLGPVLQRFGTRDVEIMENADRVVLLINNDLIFGSNYYVIIDQGKQLLAEVGRILASYPEYSVKIQGHYDNTTLSETKHYQDVIDFTASRAAAVFRYLNKEENLNGNQLSSSGMGGYYPRVSNATPAGQRYNRRIELHIVPNTAFIWDFLN